MSGTALRWMIAGEWRAHPARVVLAVAAIAIGVALGFAVHLVNGSALSAFDAALHTVNGDADLRVEAAGPAGFDEALYPRVARLPGVAAASPVVVLHTRIGDAALTLLGVDPLRAGGVTPSLIGRPANGNGGAETMFDTDSLFLSQAALAASGRRAGEAFTLADARFRIAGTLPGVTEGQAIGVVDVATAQWRLGRLGRLDRIDLKLAEGARPEQVRTAIAALLPPGAVLATTESDARSSDSLSRAYRVNLDMLALVALLTGAFLVYSAQSLSVARRAPQFALLRVLGAGRAMLVRQLVVEGAILGLAGALTGLALGYALAAAALDLLGGDLGGGYFVGTSAPLLFAPGAAALFLTLGLIAALAGSIVPALGVARTRPAVALKNSGDAVDPRRRPPVLPAKAAIRPSVRNKAAAPGANSSGAEVPTK
jgi:putative ABC transport system permease protein